MMPAAKMLDPVMGIDIHIVQPPGPVPPVPIPHPFIGMLIDPMDLAPFVGATVLVNGMPRAIAGTSGKAIPPHIPLGGMFVKPPSNECEMFMGSATVTMDGDPASYGTLPVLSCHDIGMIAPIRLNPKKKTTMKSLTLPTSMVISIPMGLPVLIGGPPTISMMGMAQKLGMAALGKAFSKWRKFAKGSQRAKAISKRIQAKAKKLMDKIGVPDSLRAKVHKAICTVTGHPVDVATGKVFTDTVDFSLPGPIPLAWERTWYSTSVYRGPLGHGWHHPYDLCLIEEKGAVAVRMADGRPLGFPALRVGQSFYQRQDKLTLRRDDAGYRLESADHLSYRFGQRDAEGKQALSRIENRQGFSIRFARNSLGHLAGIVDSAGRRLAVQCDSLGRILAIQTSHPEDATKTLALVRYRYGEYGDLLEATNALGHSWQYQYQGHLLAKETNRNGLNFHFEWDGTDHNARCLRTWGDGGIYDHKLKYDLAAQITVVTDSLGYQTTYHWNADGVVERTVDALGHATSTTFTDFVETASETDALGQVTTFEYDDRGYLARIQTPDGSRIESVYENDAPIAATDAMGGRWLWEYDESGNLIKRTNPLGAQTQFDYEGGSLAGITDALGGVTRLVYDGRKNLVLLILPNGASSSWEYDSLGRCLAAIDPLGNRQERRLDAVGNVIRVAEPDGNVRELRYDPEGNVVQAKDMHYSVRFEYQGMSRLKTRHQAGTTVKFEYDTEERLIGILNEHGLAYRFELDPTGEVLRESGFDGISRIYGRDAKGRVSHMQRASGLLAKYTYDAADRVQVIEHGEEEAEVFAYRADGSLMQAENTSGKIAFERDVLGRMLKEAAGAHWVRSEYDVLGRRLQMRSSLGAAQRITRNQLGDVEKITAGSKADENGFKREWEVRFKRDILGQELNRELPGGLRATWKRDKLGRPIQHHIHSASLVRERSYSWDPNDRIKSIVDSRFGARDFSYDGLGNLAWATKGQEFTFRAPDAVGNLFRTGEHGDRKYGPGGQLLEAKTKEGLASYAYDSEGNLVRKEVRGFGGAGGGQGEPKVWTYAWNALGQLVRVMRPDGREVTFAYDPLGRRIRKTFGKRITHWVWDGNVPLHEWVVVKGQAGDVDTKDTAPSGRSAATSDKLLGDLLVSQPSQGPPLEAGEQGTEKAPITWLFEPESFAPLAKLVGERKYSILTDHLGTPYVMADAQGKEIWSADIDLYGARQGGTGHAQACPFRFPGQYEDEETGLYYNRFRYYDPEAGAYVSQDPIGLAGGDNLYGYVSDPHIQSDEFGLKGCDRSKIYQDQAGIWREPNGRFTKHPGWPINRGFKRGKASKGTLGKGTKFDRYGGTDGNFVADLGTPFGERALPSSYAKRNFNSYEVVKPIRGVRSGPIAPWFGQPGGGIQHELPHSIDYYLNKGYIK
jgi:RHS repeat-associated protein